MTDRRSGSQWRRQRRRQLVARCQIGRPRHLSDWLDGWPASKQVGLIVMQGGLATTAKATATEATAATLAPLEPVISMEWQPEVDVAATGPPEDSGAQFRRRRTAALN